MAASAVEQVRERTDIVEIIGQHVQLRKTGRSFKGLCPFHQEKTPSFIVFPDSQNFHCFGCGAGGDVFSFVMQIDRVEFHEALQTLARQVGVTLEAAPPPPSPEETERHDRLFRLNERAAAWFSHVLWQTAAGEPGRQLLERRGIDRAAAEQFQLGFAPDRWDALLKHATSRDASEDELALAGLVTRRDDGSIYDRFRGRLMFPIRDRDERLVGFGGRALGDAQPKYLNTPETAIFDKSGNLYALHLARAAIQKAREVIVVEGYMDAIAAHQFGFRNVVASMGTALTESQARLLRRGVDRIILALDADAAGQMATLRGIDVLRDALSDADRPVADARRLIRFERTLKVDLRVVRLPEGKDPDDLIRQDPDGWRRAISEPVPLLDFYIDAVIGKLPPVDPRQKSEVVGRLAPLLGEIGDRVVQRHYVTEVARRLQIDERAILEAPRRPVKQRAAAAVGRAPAGTPEESLLALLLRHPDVLWPVLPEILEEDILDARRLAILRVLRGTSPEKAPEALEALPPELAEHAAELRALFGDRPVGFPGQIRREAEKTLFRLRKERHDQRMRQLMAEIAAAEQEKDRDALRHTLALIDRLKMHYPEFYPAPSPYFRDARDAVM
jgi:DNA primase